LHGFYQEFHAFSSAILCISLFALYKRGGFHNVDF
jgi:hypothetical protein